MVYDQAAWTYRLAGRGSEKNRCVPPSWILGYSALGARVKLKACLTYYQRLFFCGEPLVNRRTCRYGCAILFEGVDIARRVAGFVALPAGSSRKGKALLRSAMIEC
jgi:hypothetical protein